MNHRSQEYAKLKERHRAEREALPLRYAFNTKEDICYMMKKWGLNPEKDMDKVVCLNRTARCYVLKENLGYVQKVFIRHKQELERAITLDKTGNGFIYEMFQYELDDREYEYTRDIDDALCDLWWYEMSMEQIMSNEKLKHGLLRAINDYT